MSRFLNQILKEINSSFDNSNFDQMNEWLSEILNAQIIVCYGAGRVGYSMRSFAKRLSHLGLNSFFLEDTCVPKTGKDDLLIVGSGSGSTASVNTIAKIALEKQLTIISVTATPNSPLDLISKFRIYLNAYPKTGMADNGVSIQPMTSLFEQSLLILLDAIVLELMSKMNIAGESMRERHNVLE